MKRVLLLSLTLIFALSGVLYAVGVNGQYKGNDVVKVTYNGNTVVPSDVPAQLIDGRTLIPLDMLRKIGYDVGWDTKTLTANITQKEDDKSPQNVKTLEQIQALSDRVALIYALENGVRKEQGTGFMLNSKGLMITAEHVLTENGLDRALEVHIRGKIYNIPAGVTAFRDEGNDIAGVYLYDREPFTYFKVGNLPKVNDKVYALGYPNGKLDVHESKVFYVPEHGIFDVTEKYGGNSGGALLNVYGEVVGVIVKGDHLGGLSIAIEHVTNSYKSAMNQ